MLVKASVLAKKLSVCERTIYNWLAEGRIPSLKAGGNRLFDPIEVVKALKEEDSEEEDSEEEDSEEEDSEEEDSEEEDSEEEDSEEEDSEEE